MKLSERIRKERFRGGCAERAKDWADEVALLEAENAALKRENEALESEIYDTIFYEPRETDSWGKLTNKQLMALNNIGRRLAYKRQERVLLEEPNVYQMPQGDWAFAYAGVISDGYETKADAIAAALLKGGEDETE